MQTGSVWWMVALGLAGVPSPCSLAPKSRTVRPGPGGQPAWAAAALTAHVCPRSTRTSWALQLPSLRHLYSFCRTSQGPPACEQSGRRQALSRGVWEPEAPSPTRKAQESNLARPHVLLGRERGPSLLRGQRAKGQMDVSLSEDSWLRRVGLFVPHFRIEGVIWTTAE